MVIRQILLNSAADRAGIRASERLLAINGSPIRDLIDYHFQIADGDLEILVEATDGQRRTVEVALEDGQDLGIEIDPLKTRLCGNDCLFCFVDQNPKGMRKSIYVKDEDYRLSFLHGNFVTLTNMKKWEMERIVEQRLSPIYISVHSTNRETRRRLLRPKKERDLLPLIDFLTSNGIVLHTQIVLCPGYNDGEDLDRTIEDLAARWPGVRSLAIVPLGMTEHREQLTTLQPVTRDVAEALLRQVDRYAARFRRSFGVGFVYLGDEIYRLLSIDVPPSEAYDGFPQLENGIGMTRDFLDTIQAQDSLFGTATTSPVSKVTLVTGVMFEATLRRAVASVLERTGERVEVEIVACPNRFFGGSVTVAGLLTGSDIVAALKERKLGERVYIPPATLNDDRLFLDDMPFEGLAERLGVPVDLELLQS